MYRIFPRVFFFVIAVNLGVFMLGSAFDQTFVQDPFTSTTNVTALQSDFPDLYNATDNSNTFFGNFTTPTNATGAGGDDSVLFFIPDYFELPFAVLWSIWQLLTGGYVFTAIAIFGFPEYALWAFQLSIAFWGIYTLAYYAIGRG